jgi:hypothetical protein
MSSELANPSWSPKWFAPEDFSNIVAAMRFEKIWVRQCRATRRIEKHFGVESGLNHLLGEKLLTFAEAASTFSDRGAERLQPI